jgi:hypothetical protein
MSMNSAQMMKQFTPLQMHNNTKKAAAISEI